MTLISGLQKLIILILILTPNPPKQTLSLDRLDVTFCVILFILFPLATVSPRLFPAPYHFVACMIELLALWLAGGVQLNRSLSAIH